VFHFFVPVQLEFIEVSPSSQVSSKRRYRILICESLTTCQQLQWSLQQVYDCILVFAFAHGYCELCDMLRDSLRFDLILASCDFVQDSQYHNVSALAGTCSIIMLVSANDVERSRKLLEDGITYAQKPVHYVPLIEAVEAALHVLSESSHSDGKAEESDAVGSDRIEVVPASSEISGLPSSSPDVVVQISSAAQEIIEYCGSALKGSTVTSVAGRGQRPPHQQPLVSPSMRYGCHVYLIMVIINLFQDYFLLLIY
jgi:hypothetical protein